MIVGGSLLCLDACPDRVDFIMERTLGQEAVQHHEVQRRRYITSEF